MSYQRIYLEGRAGEIIERKGEWVFGDEQDGKR
jgi:hypothetical protein